MGPESLNNPGSEKRSKRRLRQGFSTGTAVVAAARAALRFLMTGEAPKVVAVRLPLGYYLPVDIREARAGGAGAWASVIKDGGDDPDVTHNAELRALVGCFRRDDQPVEERGKGERTCFPAPFGGGICVVAGDGVGVATKPGLPVTIGEPAINPVPREMLSANLSEELLRWPRECIPCRGSHFPGIPPGKAHAYLPFCEHIPVPVNIALLVEISVPEGAVLSRKTLNPRLGIRGGISILGTTGLVKPFSHEAYEETIHAALSVAAAAGCKEVVLSTGGKSEQFARRIMTQLPEEAFVQIADFYAYSVREAHRMGFQVIVHSVFFGKVLKMAQGHPYTHAHRVSLDLTPLVKSAREKGYQRRFCDTLASANTARHALELLMEQGAFDVLRQAAEQALASSLRLAGLDASVRILLFNYDGNLLVDVGN